jgi:hypothetical protein
VKKTIAWFFLIFGSTGLIVCTTAWLMGWITDREMLGITLALSWIALIIPGFNAVLISEDK